ncbi:HD domain-containing protein [Bacillus sp. BRMEA1]|uniref:HD domain-containing phosphohydrolase n=1 Tax=Neobacillus endophyticus TaxID=2738405 RepID=UPI001563E91C|nr:HD domain-containing phosphohydrolase [Neobacillus endophyticus]NRD80162.1 HD domain-containing protein [Neobacillus endophyticus]
MRLVNWFTIILFSIGIGALLYSLTAISVHQLSIYLFVVAITVILEIFPIQLPSGDQFEAGSIGVLFVLLHFGIPYAVLAITIGLASLFIKILKKVKIPLFRLIVNVGMYTISMLAALSVWKMTQGMKMIIAVAILAFLYEVVNIALLEIIQKLTANRKLFASFKQQLRELLIPIGVYSIVIPTLLIQKTNKEIIITVLYTLFFLLIVIFFSKEYTKQLSLRNSSSKAFIQVLEGRITPSLAGHGNRVGAICEFLLVDLDFPKSNRKDLIQAAIIHDIGKALLPTYIFRKRGDLTLSEEREYQRHPEKAVEIVKTMFSKSEFSDWILYHHERWDGKGFPKGLSGEQIPLGARIIAIADELDFILTRHDDAETIFKLLQEKSGTVLDPKLVEKVELSHIEMLVEELRDLFRREELPLNDFTETQFSDDSYSSIGESYFIQVQNGQIRSPKDEISDHILRKLAETALEQNKPVHETIRRDNLTLDVHAQSLKNGEVTIFVHDLSPYLAFRKNLERNILESYVDVIETLSEGKIKLLSSQAKLEEQFGTWIADIPIHNTSDVSKCRELTTKALEQYPTELQSMKVQVAVSEAVTNVLKHATKGKFSVYQRDQELQFLISDKGSGIPLHEIPKTILISGYSSKRSLGKGFKMIASFSDGVQIFTSPEGTSILIEFRLLEK